MASLYLGFDVYITNIVSTTVVEFLNSADSTRYRVDWSGAQLAGDRNLPVHLDQPTTLLRRLYATGRLYLLNGKAKTLAGVEVVLPGGKAPFSQQEHRVYAVVAGSPGGRYSNITLRYNGQRCGIDFGDPTQAWLGSPTTLALDGNGYPVANSVGNVALPQTFWGPAGLAQNAGGKWPDSLAAVASPGSIIWGGKTYLLTQVQRAPGPGNLVDFWLDLNNFATEPQDLFPGKMDKGVLIVLPDGCKFDPPDPGTMYIEKAWLKKHLAA